MDNKVYRFEDAILQKMAADETSRNLELARELETSLYRPMLSEKYQEQYQELVQVLRRMRNTVAMEKDASLSEYSKALVDLI